MAYRDVVIADAPIAYWRLGEPYPSLTAIAEVGAYRDGTYFGAPGLGAGALIADDADTSMGLAGSINDYVQIAHSAAFNVAQVSVEAWVSWISGNGGIFDKTNNGDTNNQYQLFAQFGSFVWRLNGGSDRTVAATTGIHHLVGTYDEYGMTKLYLDGVLVSSASIGITLNQYTGVSFIGKLGTFVYPFNGTIDEVAVYDYALTPEQVFNHYLAGIPNLLFDVSLPVDASEKPGLALITTLPVEGAPVAIEADFRTPVDSEGEPEDSISAVFDILRETDSPIIAYFNIVPGLAELDGIDAEFDIFGQLDALAVAFNIVPGSLVAARKNDDIQVPIGYARMT